MLHPCRASLLVVVCLVAAPSPVRADGLISWLGRLSGPGPWIGANVDFCLETFAHKEDEASGLRGILVSCGVPVDTPHWSWNLNVGTGFAIDNDLDFSGQEIEGKSDRVTYIKLGTSLMRTARRSIDAGFGGGVMFFQGPRFPNFGMPYVEPIKVAIRPLLFWKDASDKRGWLVLTADWVMLLGTVDGARFGAPADPLYERNENLMQFGIRIDITRLRR